MSRKGSLRSLKMKIRCSELHNLITKPKSGEGLSAGAITHCLKLAKQEVYGYEQLQLKALDKGKMLEAEAIELFNALNFEENVKNEERKENDYLTGECDILQDDCIVDIKVSWNLDTFPVTADDGYKAAYEWQLRGYMLLWEKPKAKIAYCLLNTPLELAENELDYEAIDLNLRVTTVPFERDAEKEEWIKNRCLLAQKQIEKFIAQILEEHK
jgi:hypothetical protein